MSMGPEIPACPENGPWSKQKGALAAHGWLGTTGTAGGTASGWVSEVRVQAAQGRCALLLRAIWIRKHLFCSPLSCLG